MIDERKLLQSTILESKIIKRKGEGNVHYLHIPQHLTREITRINPDVVIAWEYNPSARKHCSGASATAGSSSTSRTARCIRSGTSGACRSSCGISSSATPIVASKYADGA